MLDNGSVTSLASSVESNGSRSKGKGWRKPIPKFLPDPPRRISPLADAAVFHQFSQLPYSEQDHPPLPEDWRENIQKALHHEHHVERPPCPTPDDDSEIYVAPKVPSNHVGEDLNPRYEDVFRAERDTQVITVSTYRLQGDRRRSDASSHTPARTTAPLKGETTSGDGQPGASNSGSASRSFAAALNLASRHPSVSQKHPKPVINRAPTPPPPGFFHRDLPNKKENVDTPAMNDRPVEVPHTCEREAPFRIVYLNSAHSLSSIGDPNPNMNANRYAAVFPGSATDMSLDATAVDSREDVRSTANTLNTDGDIVSRPELRHRLYSSNTVFLSDKDATTRTESFKKWEASVSVHGVEGVRPVQADGTHHSRGWWYVLVHKVRTTLCMQPSTVPS